ncbi:MAG: MlaD family protein [Candidatus Tenebribacter burtonii]|jgi:phospholipid/cholesterol/gamma-HCH transport system substrate-binding protein|nr:MlaD family protein [Candidatus Tenebribacter burtonii]
MKFYQNKKNTEFKVGLFTIIAIIVLATSYMWFTETLQSKNMTVIKVKFCNAGNIEVGSNVTVNGVKKGRVKNIEIAPDGVVIDLQVKIDFPLKEGTQFSIFESNMMGDVQIEIVPSFQGKDLDLTQIQNGEKRYGLMKLVSELSSVITDFQMIMDKIAGDENFVIRIDSVIDTTQMVINKINRSLDKNTEEFERLIINANQLTAKLNKLVTTNEESISNSMAKSSEIIASINSTLDDIKETSISIRNITEKMQSEKSTINKFMSEGELYENLMRSSARLDSLLKDIKDNPKRYFNIKIL